MTRQKKKNVRSCALKKDHSRNSASVEGREAVLTPLPLPVGRSVGAERFKTQPPRSNPKRGSHPSKNRDSKDSNRPTRLGEEEPD